MGKLIAAIAGAVLLLSSPAAGQDADRFMEAMREIDPQGDVILRAEHMGSSLGRVYVADVWYRLPCYQRKRLANNLREMWRSTGGDNIVIYDRADEKVADFKILGSDMDVEGCD